MARKANPTLIGAFTVGGVVLATAALFLFGSGRFFSEATRYVLYFEGSLKGLSVGSPVTFRGIEIGSVVGIEVVLDTETLEAHVPVTIEIDGSRLTRIKRGKETDEPVDEDAFEGARKLIDGGLRAQLKVRSFVTGMLEVALDFRPDEPVNLVGKQMEYPEIPTMRSSMEELANTLEKIPVRELADSLSETIDSVTEFLESGELQKALTAVAETAERTSEISAKVEATLDDTRALVKNIDQSVTTLTESTNQVMTQTNDLLEVANERIGPLADSVQRTVDDSGGLVRNVNEEVDPLAEELRKLSASLRAAADQVRSTLGAVEGVTARDSEIRYELTRALEELSAAARSIRQFADQIERYPESLLRGKGGK